MTAYNVVNPASLVSGQPEDVSQILANFNAIASVLNGNLTDDNVKAAAAIAYSKLALAGKINLAADVDVATALAIARLAGYPADATKALFGDASWKAVTSLLSLIADSKLAVDTASWDIQNIPGNPGDELEFSLAVRSADAGQWLGLRFNNDSGANYITGTDGAVLNTGTLTSGVVNNETSWTEAAFLVTSATPANYATPAKGFIPNYAGTDYYKSGHIFSQAILYDNSNSRMYWTSSIWRNAAALTRLTFLAPSTNIKALSRLNIWRKAIA